MSLSGTCGKPSGSGVNERVYASLPVAVTVASVRPWKAWSAEIIPYAPSRLRLPHLRASLMAASLASAPLLQKKTRSNGEWSVSNCASWSWGML